MRINIFQFKDGYRYNSDSIFLIDFIKNFKLDKKEILEVGAGSGIISIVLNQIFKEANFNLLEIQKKNICLLEKNLNINNLCAKILHLDFLEFKGEFDFIISNPPFYQNGAKKSENLHLQISRYNSFLPLDHFIQHSFKILKNKGYLVFCYDAKQICDIFYFLKKYKFGAEVVKFVYPKKNKFAKLVLICARKNSNSLAKIENLIVFDELNNYTLEAKKIFDEIKLISSDYV